MFDQIPSRTVPIQSWAMVLAALITNLGVVIAACIQSGWIGKPSSVTVIAPPSSPVNSRASEIGAIDPPNELGFAISQPAAANTPAYLTGATQGSGQAPAADPQPTPSPTELPGRTVSKPILMPADAAETPLVSPP
jgi:hypothetical protein